MSENEAEIEREAAPSGPKPAHMWLDRIKEAETAFEKWRKQCENLDKLYSRNERADSADRAYAIFWANIEVLRPATYARPPAPVVAPRFKDGNVIAREASDVLERNLVVSFEQGDVDGMMREVRDEFLRYGRGTGWVRLAGPDSLGFDHVAGCDFVHELARTWREVTWVARRAWLTREQGEQRFGEAFEGVPLKKKDENAAIPDKGDKAPVWEIWDKTSGNVIWVSPDHPDILDEQPAFLTLRDFFPCPKPAYGTLVPGSLLPVPEIRQYKDQLEEINEYTARIAALSESLRMKGFYAAGQGDLSTAIEAAVKSTDDNAILIPVSSFAAIGGSSFKDSIVWLPVDQVASLVTTLVELRRVVIEDVYQITGISDIVRGQTEASETLGAQQLKSQWGSLRIRERQNELVRFARDVTRIAAEIMAENFDPAGLFEAAQAQLPTAQAKQAAMQQVQMMEAQAQQAAAMGQQVPPPEVPKDVQKILKSPTMEDVAAFLRNDRTRGFTIEIETDSTIQPDEDADKQRRTEFLTAVGGLFQQAAPLVMQVPQLGPFMAEVMKFAAGGFRAGRPLESAIDQLGELMEGMAEKAMNPAPPQPDPVQEAKIKTEEAKLRGTEAQTEATVVKAQASMADTQMKMQASAQQHSQDMERMETEAAVRAAFPQQQAGLP